MKLSLFRKLPDEIVREITSYLTEIVYRNGVYLSRFNCVLCKNLNIPYANTITYNSNNKFNVIHNFSSQLYYNKTKKIKIMKSFSIIYAIDLVEKDTTYIFRHTKTQTFEREISTHDMYRNSTNVLCWKISQTNHYYSIDKQCNISKIKHCQENKNYAIDNIDDNDEIEKYSDGWHRVAQNDIDNDRIDSDAEKCEVYNEYEIIDEID